MWVHSWQILDRNTDELEVVALLTARSWVDRVTGRTPRKGGA